MVCCHATLFIDMVNLTKANPSTVHAHTCAVSEWKQAHSVTCRITRLPTVSPLPHPQPEQNSHSSPLCCEKVDDTEISLQSFASDRAPGPWSSSQSTSLCTLVSSKVWGFHVPMNVVLSWSRAEHQFTSAHDAPRSRRNLECKKIILSVML